MAPLEGGSSQKPKRSARTKKTVQHSLRAIDEHEEATAAELDFMWDEPITVREAADAWLSIASRLFSGTVTKDAAKKLCKLFHLKLQDLHVDDGVDRPKKRSKTEKQGGRGTSAYNLFVRYAGKQLPARKDLACVREFYSLNGNDAKIAVGDAGKMWKNLADDDKKRMSRVLQPFLSNFKARAGTDGADEGAGRPDLLAAYLQYEKENPKLSLVRLLRLDGNTADLDQLDAPMDVDTHPSSTDEEDVEEDSDDDGDSDDEDSVDEEKVVAPGRKGPVRESSDDDYDTAPESSMQEEAGAKPNGGGGVGDDSEEGSQGSGSSSSDSESESEEEDEEHKGGGKQGKAAFAGASDGNDGTSGSSESESESGSGGSESPSSSSDSDAEAAAEAQEEEDQEDSDDDDDSDSGSEEGGTGPDEGGSGSQSSSTDDEASSEASSGDDD